MPLVSLHTQGGKWHLVISLRCNRWNTSQCSQKWAMSTEKPTSSLVRLKSRSCTVSCGHTCACVCVCVCRNGTQTRNKPLYSILIYSWYKNYLHLIHFFKIQAAKRHTNQIQNYKISYIYLPFLRKQMCFIVTLNSLVSCGKSSYLSL